MFTAIFFVGDNILNIYIYRTAEMDLNSWYSNWTFEQQLG